MEVRGADRVRVAVLDVGETLVDETRAWSVQAETVGVTRLTLFAALGALIVRGEDHRQVWALLGVDPPTGSPRIAAAELLPGRDSLSGSSGGCGSDGRIGGQSTGRRRV